MPTKTFLNLPIEKQNHLLESAKEEFTKHTLMDSSINKIIQDAGIPRGSFYQYFKDKEDLYFYVFDTTKKDFLEGLEKQIQKEDDLSKAFLKIYDFFYQYIMKSNREEYYKNAMLTFHKLEPTPNKKNPFFEGEVKEKLKEKLKQEESVALYFLEILSFALSKAIIDSLKEKERQKEIREQFSKVLEMLKNGYEEE